MINLMVMPFGPWIFAAAFMLAGIGLLFFRFTRGRILSGALKAAGGLIAIVGVFGLIGASVSATKLANAKSTFPLRGEVVDLGGYEGHVWCDGASSLPTIVLIAGSYGQGLWLKPLHDALAADYRVCSLDRPGVGQMKPAPSPRSVDAVVDETLKLLEASGEKGPYIFAGHSFGGLYAANLADAYPDKVVGLVLMDPTPPGWFVVQSGLFGCGTGEPNILQLIGAAYGLGYINALNPLMGAQTASLRAKYDPKTWEELIHWELRPSSLLSNASALHAPCANPFSVARTPGALGDLPMLVLIQSEDPSAEAWVPAQISTKREKRNWSRWSQYQRMQYGTMSTNAETIEAPIGATHYFPVLDTAYTKGQIQGFVEGLAVN